MSDVLNAIVPVFTGKGGVMRLAIISALVYSVMESGYGFAWGGKDGISLGQAPHAPGGPQEGSVEGIPCADGAEGAAKRLEAPAGSRQGA